VGANETEIPIPDREAASRIKQDSEGKDEGPKAEIIFQKLKLSNIDVFNESTGKLKKGHNTLPHKIKYNPSPARTARSERRRDDAGNLPRF
jgi:hypothetical protein